MDQAKKYGIDPPRDNRTCCDRASSRQRRRMTGSRSDGRFGLALGITIVKGIEDNDLIRGTRAPGDHRRGTHT